MTLVIDMGVKANGQAAALILARVQERLIKNVRGTLGDQPIDRQSLAKVIVQDVLDVAVTELGLNRCDALGIVSLIDATLKGRMRAGGAA